MAMYMLENYLCAAYDHHLFKSGISQMFAAKYLIMFKSSIIERHFLKHKMVVCHYHVFFFFVVW